MARGQIRIIGGKWRGRKLTVPSLPHLRPTPDRVRETLFNWLQEVIIGASCLDMYSGTGALGFEALSRGASHVVLVDASQEAVVHLKAVMTVLGASATIYRAKAPFELKKPETPFNVVFLDPPFQQNLLMPSIQFLEEKGFLADEAYIYIEAPTLLSEAELPSNWALLKRKKAGQVAYHLVLRKAIS